MLDEWSVLTASTPLNVFKNKGNVEAMLNESLNQFKFDSTRFQQAFNIFLRFRQCRTTCSTKCRTYVEANVEIVQMGLWSSSTSVEREVLGTGSIQTRVSLRQREFPPKIE